MKKRIIAAIILLIAIFGSVFVYDMWRGFQAGQRAKYFRPPPVAVSTHKVKKEEWDTKIEAVGTFIAIHTANITPDSEGKVVEIFFRSGDMVKKDQKLVQIDDDLLQQSLKDNEGQLKLRIDNLERSTRLLKKGAIPRSTKDLDDSLLIRAQANLERDKINIKHKKVRAPFEGRLGIRKVNIGDYIKPGDTLTSIDSLHPMYVDFMVPERYLAQIKPGQKIITTVDAYPNKKFHGELMAINSKIDVNTRNLTVRGKVPNEDFVIYPGMFANVTVITSEKKSLIVVPKTAITYSTFGDIIYVVSKKNGKLIAAQKNIVVGEQQDDWVSIEKGIKEGDEVIVSGQVKLRPNSEIIIDNSRPLQYRKLN